MHIPALQKRPTAQLILLHGYGAGSDDLAPLAKIIQSQNPALTVWLPQAPLLPEGIPGWFSIPSFDPQTLLKLLKEGAASFLEQLQENITPGLPLYLAGFSQGGMMALQLGLHHVETQGVFSFSGGLCDVKSATPPKLLHLFHGLQDDVVPAFFSKGTAEALKAKLTLDPEAGHWVEPSWIEATALAIHQDSVQNGNTQI